MTHAAAEQAPARPVVSGAPRILKKRSDFIRLSKGLRRNCAAFALQAAPAPGIGAEGPRFGLTVTKKTGTATERNRMRRRLRAALRDIQGALPPHDFVVVARRPVISAPYCDLTRDLIQAASALSARLDHRTSRAGD